MGPRWRYLFQEVVIGLKRNLLMTIATVVTVTVSLALAGAAYLIVAQVQLARDVLYAQVEVSMFLDPDISEEQTQAILRDLNENELVANTIYESKDEAYRNALKLFENRPQIRKGISPEIMPASFRVSLKDPEQFEVVASQFRGYPGIEDVVDNREVLQGFFRVMRQVVVGAASIAGLQFVAAIALIANTIRISAFARREQTGIMKLVGATNWYIRLPFVLEGVMAGALGGLIAGALLFTAEVTLLSRWKQQITIFPFISQGQVLAMTPSLMMIGGLLAAIAAFFSLRRFLDV